MDFRVGDRVLIVGREEEGELNILTFSGMDENIIHLRKDTDRPGVVWCIHKNKLKKPNRPGPEDGFVVGARVRYCDFPDLYVIKNYYSSDGGVTLRALHGTLEIYVWTSQLTLVPIGESRFNRIRCSGAIGSEDV